MGRLIDADELSFRCAYEGDCMASDENCEKCSYYVCSYEEIQEQPTAYNVDKVEEQLDEYITKIVGRKSALYQTIMMIVRKGGVE